MSLFMSVSHDLPCEMNQMNSFVCSSNASRFSYNFSSLPSCHLDRHFSRISPRTRDLELSEIPLLESLPGIYQTPLTVTIHFHLILEPLHDFKSARLGPVPSHKRLCPRQTRRQKPPSYTPTRPLLSESGLVSHSSRKEDTRHQQDLSGL